MSEDYYHLCDVSLDYQNIITVYYHYYNLYYTDVKIDISFINQPVGPYRENCAQRL